jgi:hypothetical protein
VGKSKNGNEHVYKLFALNLADGTPMGEVLIEREVKGEGFGSTGTGETRRSASMRASSGLKQS